MKAGNLKAGAAKEKITPAVGTPLGGNARINNYSTGVAQDLFARALWVDDGATPVCIVSLDLLGLWGQDAWPVRKAIAQRLGIPVEQTVLACTHTHSGPDTFQTLAWSEEKHARDNELLKPFWDSLQNLAADAAAAAKANARAASAHWATASNTEIAHNRRLRMKTGETRMNWETPPANEVECELGPIDPQVSVLVFSAAADQRRMLGGIVHYACHPAILAGANTMISSDFCGVAMQTLESDLACPAMLFLNGASGNVNHIDYKSGVRATGEAEVNRCAKSLVRSVVEAVQSGQQISTVPIAVHTREILLPIREIPEEKIRWARELLAQYDGHDISLADGVPPEVNARRILRFAEAAKTGKFPGRFATLCDGKVVIDLQTMRLGELVLGVVPSEIFVEFGLHYREEALKDGKTKAALLVGLANGLNGYIPTEAAFAEGGYEPTLGPNFLPSDTGAKITDALLKMTRAT